MAKNYKLIYERIKNIAEDVNDPYKQTPAHVRISKIQILIDEFEGRTIGGGQEITNFRTNRLYF